MLTLLSVVVSCCIMVWCLFLQCSCGRWLASKPDKEKIQMNANDFMIWSWKSNCGQIEGGRGFLMLSFLLLRFHFIFQPYCKSRKQAYRFIPDQICSQWFHTLNTFQRAKRAKFQNQNEFIHWYLDPLNWLILKHWVSESIHGYLEPLN